MTRMTRIVSDQQITLSDFGNMAKDPRDLVDTLGRTAIEPGKAYFGASVLKTSTTRVSISTPLGLFDAGAIYTRDGSETIEIDLLSALPTTGNQRVVALVISGQENPDETEERDFYTAVVNNVISTEARPTATRIYRRASIATVQGAAAPQPVRPVIDSALIVVAWVTLSSTEIVLVEQNEDDRIKDLANVADRLKDVERWRAETEPAVDGLKTDVSKLVAASGQKADRGFMAYLLEQLARLNERAGVDPGASFSYTDYFLDENDSDVANVNYVAKVEEGIRFAADNLDTKALSLLTPGDTAVQVSSGGMLLPKYSEKPVLSVLGRDAEVALSNAGSQTIGYTLKTVSRTRIRYGNSMLMCTNQAWWQTGRYDVQKNIFYAADGTTWEIEGAEYKDWSGKIADHTIFRARQFWVDTVEEPYWEAAYIPASFTGQVAGNTFLMPRSGWITGFNLGFSRKDSGGGDVRLVLCEVNTSGAPDYEKCLAHVTVPHANIKVWPEKTKFSIEPVFAEGGRRYAWFTITPGNHWLAMVEGNKYAQGTFFVSTDGAWSQGNISQDACFEILVADFQTPRLVVNLNNWNLSGGITDIDLLTQQVQPDGTTITFEVQVGSTWQSLEEVETGNSPLFGLPAALNARMVLVGTTDVMPGIMLASSFVTVSRPRTNATHISAVRDAPANVDEVRIVMLLEHYIEANHDCVVKLLTGAGYSTETTAAAVSDATLPDGTVRRTFVFTGFTPTDKWKRKTTMATTSALSIFLVGEATDIGFPA